MNTDNIVPVKKEHLLLMQVLCWLGPGIKILITGIQALRQVSTVHPHRVWWLILTAIVVAILFSLMFNNFVKRYTARILNFPERRKSLFAFFDLHGYILIFFMMGLGICLKFIPFIPTEFFAGFYPGLGTALSIAGLRYLFSWFHASTAKRI
ncbi:MAG: hypothetical protein IJS00_06890 [Paludibacteraceae bacterium]|nr:hypothetical protein [Paludibacteraceae bacterium]